MHLPMHSRRTFLTHCLGSLALMPAARLTAQTPEPKLYTGFNITGRLDLEIPSHLRKYATLFFNGKKVYECIYPNKLSARNTNLPEPGAGTWDLTVELARRDNYQTVSSVTLRDLQPGNHPLELKTASGVMEARFLVVITYIVTPLPGFTSRKFDMVFY